jgi:hypothetical protein
MVNTMTAEPHELPVIACTLGRGELAEQEQRWAELVRTAGTGRRATTDGIELRFRAAHNIEHKLSELVARERECCAWAHWEVSRDDSDLVMNARATGHGITTLQSMFLHGTLDAR